MEKSKAKETKETKGTKRTRKTKMQCVGNLYTNLKQVVVLVEDEGLLEAKRYASSRLGKLYYGGESTRPDRAKSVGEVVELDEVIG